MTKINKLHEDNPLQICDDICVITQLLDQAIRLDGCLEKEDVLSIALPELRQKIDSLVRTDELSGFLETTESFLEKVYLLLETTDSLPYILKTDDAIQSKLELNRIFHNLQYKFKYLLNPEETYEPSQFTVPDQEPQGATA